MVRFCWQVGGGQAAWVPGKGTVMDEATGVRAVPIDMELAGQNETVASLLMLPPNYLDATKVRCWLLGGRLLGEHGCSCVL